MIGRIQQRRRFDDLRRAGRRAGTEHLWCRYLPDPAAAPPRVAFAIGRAVGGAVTRNRLRRRLRAVLATAAAAGDLAPGWLLVGTKPGAPELRFDTLAAEAKALVAAVSR